MSESPTALPRPSRAWLNVVTLGVALVVLAMIVAALVLFDKPHFGWLVGTWFLPVMTSGVMVGALIVVLGTFALPQRSTWRGIVLIVWGVIALVSPLFGILFLLPWTVMLVMLPAVLGAVVGLYRQRRSG